MNANSLTRDIYTHSTFTVTCGHAQSSEMKPLVPPNPRSHVVNKGPFCGLFSGKFFMFLYFLLVMARFKMALHLSAECCLVFLSVGRL